MVTKKSDKISGPKSVFMAGTPSRPNLSEKNALQKNKKYFSIGKMMINHWIWVYSVLSVHTIFRESHIQIL